MKIEHLRLIAGMFLSALAVSLSCHKDSNPVNNGQDSISDNSTGLVPFKVGNKWIFRFYYYDTSGSIITTFVDSFAVKRDTVIGEERWYSIRGFKPADVDYLDWYTNRSDGIWVLRKVTRSNPPIDTAFAYLMFKYPTVQGEYWGSPLGDSTRVLSMNEIIETPSGIDTCIKYEDHFEFSQLGDMQYYFAQRKGWVVFEEFTQTNSGRLYVVARDVLIKAILK